MEIFERIKTILLFIYLLSQTILNEWVHHIDTLFKATQQPVMILENKTHFNSVEVPEKS